MADTKTINTRISLKYDLYSTWSAKNPVLLKGEVALAYIPAETTLTDDNAGVSVTGTTPPHIMMKVGDGVNHYNDLKFISGLAADVKPWAKAAVKPEYTATEIKGLEDFIAGEIQDTDTQYKVEKVNDYQYKLMAKGLGDAEFADVDGSVIDIPEYDDTALTEAIETLNGDGEGSVAKAIADAIAALDLANTYAAKEHGHVIDDVEGLQDAINAAKAAGDNAQDAFDSYKETNDAAVEKIAEDLATEAQTARAAEQANATAAANAQAAADAIYKVDGENVTGVLAEEIARAKAAEQANADAIALLTNGVDPNTIDGVNDLIDYVNNHGATVTGLQESIAANTKAIEDEVARATKAESDIVGKDGDASTANTVFGAKKFAEEKAAAAQEAAVGAAAEDATSKANKALDDAKAYADGLAGNYDAAGSAADALADAKAYADGLAGNYDAAGSAADALADAKEYADGLAGNYDAAGSAAAAEKAAKEYADGLDEAMAGRVDDVEATANSAVQSVSTGTGLKATKTGTDVAVEIDDSVVFIFNCGNADIGGENEYKVD